jgi:steroid delta-isomerase-like uncharacterized protein
MAGGAPDRRRAAVLSVRPKEVVRRYLDALERHNLAGLEAVLAEDVVVHRPGGEEGLRGREAFLSAQEPASFTDQRLAIDDMLADGDRVVVRYRLTCRHTGPLSGIPPTGREIRTSGIKIYRVRDGLIDAIWGEDDLYGLLAQLGVVRPLDEVLRSG